MNEYVNQLIGLDWIESDWYELVRKRKKEKKNFFFPWWVGGVLFWINNNNNKQFHYIQHVFKITRIHYIYIYIYIQSTTKDKKDINKIKKE